MTKPCPECQFIEGHSRACSKFKEPECPIFIDEWREMNKQAFKQPNRESLYWNILIGVGVIVLLIAVFWAYPTGKKIQKDNKIVDWSNNLIKEYCFFPTHPNFLTNYSSIEEQVKNNP